ncbi:hypothetical protein ACFX43_08985 [Nocardioides sp. YIM B13467]
MSTSTSSPASPEAEWRPEPSDALARAAQALIRDAYAALGWFDGPNPFQV